MASEQELKKTNPLHKEFQTLLDKEFSQNKLVENQIVKAKVVEILKSFIVCDVNYKSEAMIPISEFNESELSKIKVDDTISVFIERLENRSGEIVLSYSKAKSFAAWQKCVDAFEKEEELKGHIVSKIRGGFIVEIFHGAISAFLPQSHLDLVPVRGAAVDRFMRTPLTFRIVRLDRSRGNVSLSRKEVLLRNRNAEIKENLKNIKEGDIIENAIVKAIPDGKWGAFLELGNNCTALLHQSDISHNRISSITDILSVGQKIPKVMITKIDDSTNRISVSIKSMFDSPYKNIEKHFVEGKIYNGIVNKCVEYGAFISLSSPTLDSTVEALCHTSELSYLNRPVKTNNILSVSQKAKFKILTIDKENKKISVSYKQASLKNPWDKIKEKIGETVKIKINNITDKAIFGELVETGLIGMLHYKEISYDENNEDLKKFKKNEIIEVKISEIKDDKIKFSKRALDKDPLDWFKDNNKKVGDVITTRIHEVLKTGVKVSIDKDKKLIVTIRKADLAKETADQRVDIFSSGNALDAKLIELDYKLRKIKLSPKAAQLDEEKTLIQKFGENATKSGATLKGIFEKAIGKKGKKEK